MATQAPTSLNLALAEPSAQLNRLAPGESAAPVVTYVFEQGVSAERHEPEGYGPTPPLIEGAPDPAERAKKQRVDFRIVNRSTDGGAQ